ncbi:MAG: ABC transporter permease, partial [Pseudorhodobacter sp.]|nr:ABC transporter permease [Frankiaceae bacterium]
CRETAAAVGMAFSGLVAGAGLLLTTAEGLVERRRTLARLAAAGTDPSTLRRAVLLQVAWPTLPAAVLATVTGVLVLASTVTDASFVVPGLLALPVAAVAVSLLAGAASLPFLRRATDLEQLRVA